MNGLETLLSSFDQAAVRAEETAQSKPFKRIVYRRLEASLLSFVNDPKAQSRWIIIPGLRGVGKTVLLAQLYNHPSLKEQPLKFYLSLDNLAARNIDYNQLIEAVETKIESRLHETKSKVFLFLDEIHFWDKWSVGLKVLYDNCPNLFLVCTGSSALALNLNPDSGRRADIIRVAPLSLTEYILMEVDVRRNKDVPESDRAILDKIHHNLERHILSDLPQRIERVLFGSKTAMEVYGSLQNLQPEVDRYWGTFSRQGQKDNPTDSARVLIGPYIDRCLTLPYAIISQHDFPAGGGPGADGHFVYFLPNREFIAEPEVIKNELRIKEMIQQTLGLVLERDLEVFNRFDQTTRSTAFDFLRLIADSDTISLQKISDSLSPDRTTKMAINTIRDLLRALCQAEILNEIQPLRASFGRTTKSSKYLFTAPAIRSALLPMAPAGTNSRNKSAQSAKWQMLRGRLLEDTIGMYLKRLFVDQPLPRALEYDARAGGADFVISRIDQRLELIAIEVGWNKRNHHQITQTRKRLKFSPYGLVITGNLDKPRLDEKNGVVYLPLSTFLLI